MSKINAGKATIIIEANRSRLAAGLDAAKKQLATFAASTAKIGAGMMGGGAAILSPIAAMAKTFASNGDMLDKMSMRTGMSVEALGELAHAASLSGTSIEAVEKSIRKMQQGLAAGSDVFAKLGLDPDKLKAMAPEQAFAAIADRINMIEDPAERVAVAMEIFGRNGAEMLPILSAGSSGMAAFGAEARRLGAVMSGEDAKAAAALTDALDRMGKSFTGLINVIGASVAPMLSAVFSMLTHGVVQVRNFIDANRGMVLAVTIGGFALGVLGAGLVTAAGLAYGLSVAIGVATTVATAAGTVFAAIGTVLTGGVGAAIAAVVVGLVGLAGYFAYTSGAGGKAMDWLFGKFRMLSDIAGPVFQGIQDAMAGGNFKLAAEILWLGVQVAFAKGTSDLKAAWDQWLNGMLGQLDQFIIQFRSKWNDVSGWLADRMLEAYGYFDESFDVQQAKQIRAENTAQQNKAFAAGGANRAAGRDAVAEANMREREKAIEELEAKLSESTAMAAQAAAEAASTAVDTSLGDLEAPGPADAGSPIAAQSDNELGKASDAMRGTFSGFAAALMGQSGGYDLDAEMLAENKAQTQYLAEMAGALVATQGTQVMLEQAGRDPMSAPGAKGPSIVAQLDPALHASLQSVNTTLASILARLKEMEGGFV